jgi:hypothetical protein
MICHQLISIKNTNNYFNEEEDSSVLLYLLKGGKNLTKYHRYGSCMADTHE